MVQTKKLTSVQLGCAEENESDYLFPKPAARQSHVAGLKWDQAVMAAIEKAVMVDPYKADVPDGTVIPAVEAVDWSGNSDIRPRLLDKSTGQFRLLDSGSMITAAKKLPGDKPDNSLKLVAVNGSEIKTYGVRNLEIKIGRKSYSMPAVICDIAQDILGADFINKYRLGLEWDDFDQTELYITDKKAQTKTLLSFITVPQSTQRVAYLQPGEATPISTSDLPESWLKPKLPVSRLSNEEIEFQVACIKKLEKVAEKSSDSDQNKGVSGLSQHDAEYVKMIQQFPQLLEPTFSKATPVHGVWHRIDTGHHPPSRAKRRPLIANAAKAAEGRRIWKQMEKDGVIERVKPNANTDWASALHLANKPGGGVRPCTDFRDLNRKTVLEAYQLPLLRDFQSKIHGSTTFSRVDLKSAFFNIPIWPDHKFKTTTVDPWGGTYVYNRLPFGLCSGPASWQKLLDHILKDVASTFVYLDHVLIFGKSMKDHDQTLQEVFKKLAENNMALSLDKCIFGKPEVEYLGYMVTSEGIRPLPKKLAALENFKKPTSQKEVLHFCGALNYFRTSLRGVKREDGSYKSAAAVLQPLYSIGTDKIPTKTKFVDIWDKSKILKTAFAEAKEML